VLVAIHVRPCDTLFTSIGASVLELKKLFPSVRACRFRFLFIFLIDEQTQRTHRA
jgi:hypothetical protein